LPVTFRYFGDWWDVSITSEFVYLDAPGQITHRQLMIFGGANFSFMGGPPGRTLRDRPSAGIGVGDRVTDILTVSTLLVRRRALVKGNDDPVGLYGILMLYLSPTLSISPYVFAGLTGPDLGLAFEVSCRFGCW